MRDDKKNLVLIVSSHNKKEFCFYRPMSVSSTPVPPCERTALVPYPHNHSSSRETCVRRERSNIEHIAVSAKRGYSSDEASGPKREDSGREREPERDSELY